MSKKRVFLCVDVCMYVSGLGEDLEEFVVGEEEESGEGLSFFVEEEVEAF